MTGGEANGEAKEICATPNCGKPASLQCPTCIKLALKPTHFCSQDCFKASWKDHNAIHQRAKAIASYVPFSFPYTGTLRPAYVSPMRTVPAHIKKPEYAVHGQPSPKERDPQIHINTPEEIEGIRAACKFGREILDLAHRHVRVGITTEEIDEIVHNAIVAAGHYPSPLNYHNFPKSCCTSVNEVICHGIPDARPLEDGDIVNVDISVYVNGYHGDLNETYCVGNVDAKYKNLIKTTHDALMLAIQHVRPGNLCRDFGGIISHHVGKEGFSVVRAYCGHGIGSLFHTTPNIPHYARNKAVGTLKPGMIFTIEPMINMGVWNDKTWPDDWTSVTADGMRSAQFEHQVLVTETGYELLTARTADSPPLWWEKEGALPAAVASPAPDAQPSAAPASPLGDDDDDLMEPASAQGTESAEKKKKRKKKKT